MEKLKKKYIYHLNWLTSSSSNLIILLLLGLILIGFGVLLNKTGLFSSGDSIEVLNSATETQNTSSEIVVEIAGSIQKPGVYKLSGNSRVEDLLTVSGGLSLEADRDWVNKNINRASKLTDGQKIYIYSQSEVTSAKENGGIKLDQVVLGDSSSKLVNINTASQKELESLVGIGPVLAQKIIDKRIYSKPEDLVEKGVLTLKTFEKIKSDITY